MRVTTQAATMVAAIVKVRTQQLELRLQANRRSGGLTAEQIYRAGELDAHLAELRSELRASEELAGKAGAALADAADG